MATSETVQPGTRIETVGGGNSVAEPEPPGAAPFRTAPEPEPIFFLVGARSRSRLF